ncbi:MAG: DUF2142 domain-containing protein [Eubacteriales bacterium]|nr:DUF2142 domain-containing protein [Eubacteriales bacterium]
MKLENHSFRNYAGFILHLLILGISLAISAIIHLIRGHFNGTLHCPFRSLFTFALFMFAIAEITLCLADRRVLYYILNLRQKAPITRKKVLLVLLAMCGISLFCAHTTDRFDRTTERISSQKRIILEEGEMIEQDLIGFEDAPLTAVNIRFGLNGREHAGTVHVRLLEDGTEVQSWQIPVSLIRDRVYRELDLDSLLNMNVESRYSLQIYEEFEEDASSENRHEYVYENQEQEADAVCIWVNTTGGDGYRRNGEDHICTLCYTLTYRNVALKNHFTLIGVLLGILVTAVILLDLRETAVMAVLLGILLYVFMQICPPFMAPDEENHFKKAFEVAKIGYVSAHIGESGVGGNTLPVAIDEYVGRYIERIEEETEEFSETVEEEAEEEEELLISPAGFPEDEALAEATDGDLKEDDINDDYSHEEESTEDSQKEDGAEDNVETSETAAGTITPILIDWEETEEMVYGNTALYSPVSYLPLSAGIRIANVFSDNVSTLYYAGRWGNLIANFFLCIFALRLAPFGKRILFLIMTFPMTLQEMVALTPDGFTISVCLFFAAFILHLSYDTKKAGSADLVSLALISVVLSQLKIIYVILLLLIFMIPGNRFPSRRASYMYKGCTSAFALALNLLWLQTSSGFLVEFNPGVDTPAQVNYVLTHIPAFYMICARTFVKLSTVWLSNMIGSSLGALTISTTPIIWVTAMIMFVYEMSTNRENRSRVHRWDPVLLMLSFLLGCALIMSSLYVQWTPFMNPVINGIQGRYFTPLLPLLAYFVILVRQNRRGRHGFDPDSEAMYARGRYCYLLILFYNGIAVLDIAHHYIADLWY